MSGFADCRKARQCGVTGGQMPTETGKQHKTRLPRRVGVLTVFCLAFSLNVFGQGAGNSTVTGTVVDNVGAVPDATVTLTETATGVVRSSPTNETGAFRFAALPPGQYSLKVEMQGFTPV